MSFIHKRDRERINGESFSKVYIPKKRTERNKVRKKKNALKVFLHRQGRDILFKKNWKNDYS